MPGSAASASFSRQVEAMSGSLKQYQTHFASVVVKKMRLGLDEKSGLEGRLRASVHDVEARLAQLHQPALAAPMLMLRRHEKDFMLRHDVKYGDETKKQASEFIAEVEKTDIPEAAKAEIRLKLAEYLREFSAWFDTALKLDGETRAMSETFSAVEPVIAVVSKAVDGIRLEAEQSNVKIRDSITWQMEVAIFLIALGVLARDLKVLHEVGSAKQNAPAPFDQRHAERSRQM